MSGRVDKTELIKKLQQLEGLTDEEKSNLIGLLRQHKKYGLVWEDKPEDVEERLREELPVLTEVKERRIISDAPDAPNHILIEGDNLEALTALSYTHEGKIDVIYIDPPYNTGNKDFVYNDSYVDTEDNYRHSKWLSFMSKRLRIAKRLLSDKGVIFISIGDDEIANLPLLCKEIFGEKNYIETYIWTSTLRPDNSSPILRRNAEFVICCSKNASYIKYFNGVISETSGMPSLTKAKEKLKTIIFPANVVKTNLSDGIYYAGLKENGRNPRWELLEDVFVKDGKIITEVKLRGHSYWATQKKIKEELEAGTEIWIKSETFVPYYKKDKEAVNRPTKILPVEYVKDGLFANTELNDGIFNHKVFNNPKPSTLISFLINFIDNKEVVILDFFAGSGTTLHATMQLNEDGGHRQCILVTNNENGICEQVTYERNKRVIQGYTTPKGQVVEGLHNNNLRYYRTEFISRDRTQRNMRALVNAATDLLCIKEDLYEEKPLLGTLKLKPQLARYFSDGQKHMLVVYREEVVTELVEAIKTLELGKSMLKIYIFSPGRYAFDDNFYEVQDKVQLVALPAAIYDAYQRVLPKQKERLLDEAEEPAPQPTASAMTIDFEEGGEQ